MFELFFALRQEKPEIYAHFGAREYAECDPGGSNELYYQSTLGNGRFLAWFLGAGGRLPNARRGRVFIVLYYQSGIFLVLFHLGWDGKCFFDARGLISRVSAKTKMLVFFGCFLLGVFVVFGGCFCAFW